MIAIAEAESVWTKPSKALPPRDQQVLIRLVDSVGGEVCDVACYVGKQTDGEDRWILADIRLDTRQIAEWAFIYPTPPKSLIKELEGRIAYLTAQLGEAE